MDSIDEKTGRSIVHDCISIHFILNLFLPAKAQIQILPRVSYEDSFFSFTESQLVSCLLKEFRVSNNKLVPVTKKIRQLSSGEQNSQHILAKILNAFFGSKVSAEKNTQDEVGRLSLLLFLNGKNTSYRRGANILWSKDSLTSASSSSSLDSTPLLQKKCLKTKIIFEPNNVDVINEARAALEKKDAKDPQYATSKLEFQNLVRGYLLSPEKYKEQIDDSEPGQQRQKYVLTGNLSTNGYDLRVMAYKLTENRRSRPSAMTMDTGITKSNDAYSELEARSNSFCISNNFAPSNTEEKILNRDSRTITTTATSSSSSPPSPIPIPITSSLWSTAPTLPGWEYISKKFDSQEKVDNLFQKTNIQDGIRCIGIDPGIANTATATLIHSGYKKDNINLSIPRGPRNNIDCRYRQQLSLLKIKEGITKIESKLVGQKPIEAKLAVGEFDVTMEGGLGITGISYDGTMVFTKAVEDYESSFKAYVINVTSEASTLRSFYGGATFKQDKYKYRETLRHDLDKATTAILQMRNCVPDKQPSDEDLDAILFQLHEDIRSSQAFFDGLPNVKAYDWGLYQQLMSEVDQESSQSGVDRKMVLESEPIMRRLKKIAMSLFKRGFLFKNTLPHRERMAFLQSPLVIGLGDGDFRSWSDHGRGGSKFTRNLIRQVSNTHLSEFN